MKVNFYSLLTLVAFLTVSSIAKAQTTGDYRSNVAVGDWSTAATWQTYNGTTWVTATSAPTAGTELISIVTGDSVRITTAQTIDNVNVNSGGVLAINGNTATLNNGFPGSDLVVNGRVYVGVSPSALSGTGSVKVNTGGLLVVRNSATLAAATTNSGEADFSGGTFITAPFTNNALVVWSSGNIALTSTSFTNNAQFSITTTSALNFNGNAGSSFSNTSTGVISALNTGGMVIFQPNVNFTNTGTVNGTGNVAFEATTLANSGTITPGNGAAGILTVNPNFVTGFTPAFNITIDNTGGVAGTNYGQVDFSTAVAANVSGSSLTVTDNATDPAGTSYTLLSSPAGSITGTFASVNLPGTFGPLSYGANAITVTKTSTLPLTWGNFTALAQENNAVLLTWSTLQELNTSHFSVDYSTDGSHFTSIGTVAAKGNSSLTSSYSFTHTSPVLNGVNYYRIQEVDLDGQVNYSTTALVRFFNGKAQAVVATPNPVAGTLQLNIQADNLTIQLSDLSGRKLQTWYLQRGTFQTDVHQLPAGVYQLSVFQGNEKIGVQNILKL